MILQPYKNGQTGRDVVWGVDSGQKEPCIGCGPDPSTERGTLLGGRGHSWTYPDLPQSIFNTFFKGQQRCGL